MTYVAYNRVLVIQEVDIAYRTARASSSNGISGLRPSEKWACCEKLSEIAFIVSQLSAIVVNCKSTTNDT